MNNEIDYLKGKKIEDELYNDIKQKFNLLDLKQSTYKYSKFDYYNNDYYIELKSRNCNSDTYNDIFFNYDKITYGLSKNKKMIFVFKFIDKILFIEYNKDIFDKYKVSRIKNRWDRGRDEFINCIFIPKKDMNDF